ncbi:TPA: hypothetical protein VAS93_000679 [Streptococcus agalactiae]|nr:hypothetical protein [Streptococcus agalactiae]
MVSYEKVRRSLRTATITIIVLNSLSLVFRLFTGISVQLAKTEINKGNTGNLPKEHIEAVLSATTPFMLFVTALIVLVNIAIVILGFLTTKAPWAIAINIVFQAIFGLLYFHAYQKAQKLNERDLEETN